MSTMCLESICPAHLYEYIPVTIVIKDASVYEFKFWYITSPSDVLIDQFLIWERALGIFV